MWLSYFLHIISQHIYFLFISYVIYQNHFQQIFVLFIQLNEFCHRGRMDAQIQPEVKPLDVILSIVRHHLSYLYDLSDGLESTVPRDEGHQRSLVVEKRFYRSHVKGLLCLEKVLECIKAFLVKVQGGFGNYNLLLEQFTPDSETFLLIDAIEEFILKIQRFNTVHEDSRGFLLLLPLI